MNASLPPVLAAEDEESDALILQLAFARSQFPVPLVILPDGAKVIHYLSGSPPYSDRIIHPFPRLLLLDLKMPGMTGFDVLSWLQTRPDLQHLPALILSSSFDESDILKARALGARDFFTKPHSLPELLKLLELIRSRWL